MGIYIRSLKNLCREANDLRLTYYGVTYILHDDARMQ